VTAFFVRLAVMLVRGWTAAYTWGMPSEVGGGRRAEIDSDLWELQHAEPADVRLAMEIVGRLVLGVPDDLGWRSDHQPAAHPRARVVWALVLAVTCAVVFSVLWMGRAQALPVPEPVVRFARVPAPPPPPPSPPPCNPPGIDRAPVSPCTR
jgi:hypothetical protein